MSKWLCVLKDIFDYLNIETEALHIFSPKFLILSIIGHDCFVSVKIKQGLD
jgi:hypothetical protein